MNIKKATVNGLVTIGASKIIQQGISFIITVFLATLLSPRDFGLVGIVVLYTGFLDVFSSIGLGSAVVQSKTIDQNQLSTIYWVNLIGGVVANIIMILAAYPISWFYKEPELIYIIVCMSFNFTVGSLYSIQKRILEKELNFRIIGYLSIITTLLSGVFGIISAVLGLGLWSLVIQINSQYLLYMVGYYRLNVWKPARSFNLNGCKDQFTFGLNMLGSQVFYYIQRNIDYFLVSKLLGTVIFGYYTLAYRIMYFPIRQFAHVFTNVLFPVFSKVQDDIDMIKSGYLRTIRLISLISFPAMLMLSLFSEEIITILFGTKWIQTAYILKIIGFGGAIQSIGIIDKIVFPAINRPKIIFKLGIINCLITTLSIFIGTKWGIIGVSYGIIVSIGLFWIISQVTFCKILKLKYINYLNAIYGSFIGCIIILIIYNINRTYNIISHSYTSNLIYSLLLCGGGYFAFILLFNRDDFRYLINAYNKK